jgi:hypothetical protein
MKLLILALLFVVTSCAEIDLSEEDQASMLCPLPPGSTASYPIAGGSGGYVWVNIWYENCVDNIWEGTRRMKWVRVISASGQVLESDIYIDDCHACGTSL